MSRTPRSERHVRQPAMNWTAVGEIALVVLITQMDLFNRLLKTMPLTAGQTGLALAAAVLLIALWEGAKLIARRRSSTGETGSSLTTAAELTAQLDGGSGMKMSLRSLPGVRAVTGYRLRWLRRDVVAGVVLATLLVPQGMAYAQLAGCRRSPASTRRSCVWSATRSAGRRGFSCSGRTRRSGR